MRFNWKKSKTVFRVAVVVFLMLSVVYHLAVVIRDSYVEYGRALRYEFLGGIRALKAGRSDVI